MPTTKTAALESEATAKPTTFEHQGNTYTVPDPLDFPLAVLSAEDELSIVRLILGDEQWAAFEATKPTIRQFQELAELVDGSTGN